MNKYFAYTKRIINFVPTFINRFKKIIMNKNRKNKRANERFKELDAFVDKFLEDNDMLLAIYSPNFVNSIGFHFCGDERILRKGFEGILNRACDLNIDDKNAMSIVDAFMNAIVDVISGEDVEKGTFLSKIVDEVIRTSIERCFKRMLNYANEAIEEDDDDCSNCKNYNECLEEKIKEVKETLRKLESQRKK